MGKIMNIDKTKIIVTGGILVLSIFVGLFIRISLREPQSKSEQTSVPSNLSVEFPKPSSSSDKPSTLKELNIPTLPIPKPDLKAVYKKKSLPSTTTQFFENINKAAKAVEKSLISDNAPIQKTSITTSKGIILSLTKDQFNFLYPKNFIADLIDIQTLFIKESDPAYEPLPKIETDAQVRFVEEKIVATLLSENMITKERAEQFITTIRFTLPELQLIDLKTFNSYSFYESPRKAPKGLFLAGLTEALKNALAHKAQAAICGYCVSSPLCFQEGASTPAKPGTEVVKFACYCTGCLSSLGCLSSFTGQAAIFDQSTGICGAGR